MNEVFPSYKVPKYNPNPNFVAIGRDDKSFKYCVRWLKKDLVRTVYNVT